MSDLLLFFLLALVSCSSYNDVLIEFKEDGSVIETPVYREPRDRQQGSGMGMNPHMRMGPGGRGTVTRPDTPSVHVPPPLNDGSVGTPIVIAPDDPGTPEVPSGFNVNITFINQTTSEKAKYNAVRDMLETIVPSQAFKDKVLLHRSCNGAVGYYGTSGELGNVNTIVYNHIRAGDERKPNTTAVDQELDIKIEMYRDDASSTIGYTYATSDQIWVNRKFSDNYKPSSLGSNMFHEWLHKLSYGHSSSATTCRPYSIPYAIGYMARDFMKPLEASYGY